ncbi:hypothetical protein C8R44DRAFT_746913 [Mycena epipterygia]|nr:hypothetical protein C8R44DRAFT_746913 [Mycena epipterygia]
MSASSSTSQPTLGITGATEPLGLVQKSNFLWIWNARSSKPRHHCRTHPCRKPASKLGDKMLQRIHDKGAGFFPSAARHMDLFGWIAFYFDSKFNDVWPEDDLETLLRVYTGVQHLLIIGDLVQPPLFLMVEDMGLTHLFIAIDLNYRHLDFTHPFFQAISHLAIGEFFHLRSLLSPYPRNDGTGLPRLSALTHFALCTLYHRISVQLLNNYSMQLWGSVFPWAPSS